MFYADHFCKVTEAYQPKHKYTFTGKSLNNGQPHSVTVNAEDLYKYRQGGYVQDVFPYLSANDREFLISGYTSLDFLAEDEDE